MDVALGGSPARSHEQERGTLLLAWRESEEAYCDSLRRLETYRAFFVANQESEAPLMSQTEIAFVFYNTQPLLLQHTALLEQLANVQPLDSVCDAFQAFITNEVFKDGHVKALLGSGRSFELLSRLMATKKELRDAVSTLDREGSGNTLGSLLGSVPQRIHFYPPLLEELQKYTTSEHQDAAKIPEARKLLQEFLAGCPVVSKIGITKLLQLVGQAEAKQVARLPSEMSASMHQFSRELIAEGAMWELIRSPDGTESMRKCYIVLFVNRVVCLPFEKKESFKPSSIKPLTLELVPTPDILWSASLVDCTFQALPQSQMVSRSSEKYRLEKAVGIRRCKRDVFVISETAVIHTEPFVLQQERTLIPDTHNPKDRGFWLHSFNTAQKYTNYTAKQSFAELTSQKIFCLEEKAKETALTEESWRKLSAVGTPKTYQPGARIIDQGQVYSELFWIERGAAMVTENLSDAILHVANFGIHRIFGAISFFARVPTSGIPVIATEESIVFSAGHGVITRLLEKDADFAQNFFQALSSQIALSTMTSAFSLEKCPSKAGMEISSLSVEGQDSSRVSPHGEVFSPRSSTARGTTKEHREVLKHVGVNPKTPVLLGTSCKVTIPGWKKPQSGSILCLDNIIIIYSKGLGANQAILPLQQLNPVISEFSIILSARVDAPFTITFRTEEKRALFVTALLSAKEAVLSKIKDANAVKAAQCNVTEALGEDWYSLMAKAETLSFDSGDLVLRQGDPITGVYQLVSGECSVFVEREEQPKFDTVQMLLTGERFGEFFFLYPGQESTCSIVVTSEKAEVLLIPLEILNERCAPGQFSLLCSLTHELSKRYVSRQTFVRFSENATGFKYPTSSAIRWQYASQMEEEPQLVAQPEGYHVEFGNFKVSPSDRLPVIADMENDYQAYAIEFAAREHINIIGFDSAANKFALVSAVFKIYSGDVMLVVLVRTEAKGNSHLKFATIGDKATLDSLTVIPLVKQHLPDLSSYQFHQVPPDQHERIRKDLIRYEENETIMNYKFGLLYQTGAEITESEIYSTPYLSPDLLELMIALGELVVLEDWPNFRGGLDCTGKNITGATSLYTKFDHRFEIMFHVAPLIPCEPNDDQFIGKKRHLGNDLVLLIFTDSDHLFDPSHFNSHFNHTFIVVKKLPVEPSGGLTFYRVETISNTDIPFVCRPVLPSPSIIPKSEIRKFLLTKLINSERMAMKTAAFQIKIERTRHQLLESYGEKYAAQLQHPTIRHTRSNSGFKGRRL